MEKVNQIPLKRRLLQLLSTVCLGGISLGSSLSWTSPVLPWLQQSNSTLHITMDESTWIASSLALGTLTCAIPAGCLADRFGRKICTLAFVVPVLVFATLVAVADNACYLYAARIFSGFATGGASVIAPIYIGEISNVEFRGILGSFFEMLIYIGVLLAAILGAYLYYITFTTALAIMALALGILFMVFFPESPTYLMMTNRRDLAEKALKFYRGEKYDVTNDLDQIQENLDTMAKTKGNFGDIWKSKAAIRGLVACVGVTVFQQLCGVNGIIFYCVYIFQMAGARLDKYTSSVICAVVQLLSAVMVVFIMERANRRTFLYLSGIGTGVSLASLGTYFVMRDAGYTHSVLDAIPLTSLIIFFISFALGLGPVPWLMNGELFTPEIKGPANGIIICTNWSLLFLVTKFFPIMFQVMTPQYTFYMFAACMVAFVFFIKFCVPETRGKSLLDIQKLLDNW